jgi:hypothetical protein
MQRHRVEMVLKEIMMLGHLRGHRCVGPSQDSSLVCICHVLLLQLVAERGEAYKLLSPWGLQLVAERGEAYKLLSPWGLQLVAERGEAYNAYYI